MSKFNFLVWRIKNFFRISLFRHIQMAIETNAVYVSDTGYSYLCKKGPFTSYGDDRYDSYDVSIHSKTYVVGIAHELDGYSLFWHRR